MNNEQLPSLAKMLTTMNRVYTQHMTEQIQAFGINLTDLSIILGLDQTPGVSLNAFALEKKINKAILSKELKKLQANDFVRLEHDPEHKQRYKLYITDKAKRLVPKLRKHINAYQQEVLKCLSTKEQQSLLRLFNRVYQQELADSSF